jgi:O-acetylhomoserine (thiol)-lyase
MSAVISKDSAGRDMPDVAAGADCGQARATCGAAGRQLPPSLAARDLPAWPLAIWRERAMADHEPGFSTLSIHAGARPDPTTGARVTPIYQTTAFVFDDVDHAASLFGLQAFGNIYTRITNPTTAVLEERVAALEGGPAALAVASGHAAQMLVFHTLMQAGDEFIASTRLYGGSINQFNHAFKNFDWRVKWADTDQPQSFEAAVTERTKAIFVESLANPGGVVTDLAAIAAIARRANVPLIVDNTLASPYLIRPFEHGADIIVHSATKYLGGHGNSMAGVIVDGGSFDWSGDKRYPMLSAPRPEYNGMVLAETFGNFAFAIACRVLGLRDIGPAISPFNSFLVLTGIETLALRMQRHCDNALAVARHLEKHERVGWVSYAGLPGNRYHELARRYCPKGAGGVFTFGVKGGYDAGVALVSNLKLFSHLANIGDTRSLVIHPASTTHRQLSDAQKTAAGAGPDVVRLSIGLEDVADLTADLDQALA